jgi:hypothetical protein
MPTDNEVAALLDLAEYARELSDIVSSTTSKQVMLGIAVLCEALAFRLPDAFVGSTQKDG